MTTVRARSDFPIGSTWNHESVFPSFVAWREEYRATMANLPEIESNKGTLAQGPERLAEALQSPLEVDLRHIVQ